MATVSFDRSEVVALLVSLGFQRAPNLSDKQILATINSTFDEYGEDDVECCNPKLLARIKKALKKGGELTLTASEGSEEEGEAPAKSKKSKKAKAEEPVESDEGDEDGDEEEEAPKTAKKAKTAKPAKKSKKAEPVEDEEEESTDDEGEGDDEEEAPKGRAKKKLTKADKEKSKKAKSKGDAPKKAGVIDAIESILKAASKSNPISKAGITEKLAEMFPDREADKMAKTVAAQVPKRLHESRGLNIVKVDGEEGVAFYVSKK